MTRGNNTVRISGSLKAAILFKLHVTDEFVRFTNAQIEIVCFVHVTLKNKFIVESSGFV